MKIKEEKTLSDERFEAFESFWYDEENLKQFIKEILWEFNDGYMYPTKKIHEIIKQKAGKELVE